MTGIGFIHSDLAFRVRDLQLLSDQIYQTESSLHRIRSAFDTSGNTDMISQIEHHERVLVKLRAEVTNLAIRLIDAMNRNNTLVIDGLGLRLEGQ